MDTCAAVWVDREYCKVWQRPLLPWPALFAVAAAALPLARPNGTRRRSVNGDLASTVSFILPSSAIIFSVVSLRVPFRWVPSMAPAASTR